MACVICPRLNAYEDDEIRDEAGRIQMTLGTGTGYEGEYEKTNVDLITQHFTALQHRSFQKQAQSRLVRGSDLEHGSWSRGHQLFKNPGLQNMVEKNQAVRLSLIPPLSARECQKKTPIQLSQTPMYCLAKFNFCFLIHTIIPTSSLISPKEHERSIRIPFSSRPRISSDQTMVASPRSAALLAVPTPLIPPS